jgi:putative acetyltransferase
MAGVRSWTPSCRSTSSGANCACGECLALMRDRTAVEIRVDDLSGSEVIALLREHLRCMALVSPPESRHALDLDGLRKPDVIFWSIWNGSDLAGCGALKELDEQHAEIKSMRTAYAYQRKRVASQMLRHLIEEAKRRGYRRVSLETGSMEYFEPARRLYASFGFAYCGPFGSYTEDSNSIFMTKELDSPREA